MSAAFAQLASVPENHPLDGGGNDNCDDERSRDDSDSGGGGDDSPDTAAGAATSTAVAARHKQSTKTGRGGGGRAGSKLDDVVDALEQDLSGCLPSDEVDNFNNQQFNSLLAAALEQYTGQSVY